MATSLVASGFAGRTMRASNWPIAFVAGMLAIAAALKLWSFATTPSFDMDWTETPLIVLGNSGFELLLVSWLMSGWQQRAASITAMLFFLVLCCVAAIKWWSGELSCGCFGPVKVPPWVTTLLDAGVVAGLVWQLSRGNIEIPPYPKARAAAVFVLGICGALMLPAIAYYHHPVTVRSEGFTESHGLFVLEPEKWVNKRFPLLEYIVTKRPIAQGICRVVLFHRDCSDCQRLLPQIEQAARTAVVRTVLVELPPVAPMEQSIIPQGTTCEVGILDASKEWFATTPVIIDLDNGRVVRQQSGAHAMP